MAKSVAELKLDQLEKLAGYKQAYDTATTDADKASASSAADLLRSNAGIDANSSGVYNLDELNNLISSRKSEIAPTTTQDTDIYSKLAEMQDAQRAQTVAQLGKSRDESLSALGAEESEIQPAYDAARGETRSTSRRGGRSLSNYLAQKGIGASGGSALGEVNRQGALQGALGNLDVGQQSAMEDIGRRRTSIESGYQSDLASAEAGLQAQALQNAITQANADRSFNAQQEAQLFNQGIAEAGLTGLYGGQSTLGAQSLQSQLGAQDLNNQLTQGSIDNLPLQTQILQQQIDSGAISLEQAQLQLDMLQNPSKYQTYSGGGGSYSSNSVAPTTSNINLGSTTTEAPITASKDYTDLAQGLFGDSSVFKTDDTATKGQKIADFLRKDSIYQTYLPRIGEDGLQQMIQEAMELDAQEKATMNQTPELSTMIEDAKTEIALQVPAESRAQYLLDNSATFTQQFGYSGYQDLLKAFGIE